MGETYGGQTRSGIGRRGVGICHCSNMIGCSCRDGRSAKRHQPDRQETSRCSTQVGHTRLTGCGTRNHWPGTERDGEGDKCIMNLLNVQRINEKCN